MTTEPTNYATEAEARTRWCPHVRMARVYEATTLPQVVSYNRFATDEALADADGVEFEGRDLRCLGSGCMMWRWKGLRWANGQSEPTGYCGLAAMPVGSGPRSS